MTVDRTSGVFYRLRRTIAQFTVLFKFVLKTSFGITEELKAHKPSKLVPASLFLALQHCSYCSIVATSQPYLFEELNCCTRGSGIGILPQRRVLCGRSGSVLCLCVTCDNVYRAEFVLGLSGDGRVPGKSTGLKRFMKSFA